MLLQKRFLEKIIPVKILFQIEFENNKNIELSKIEKRSSVKKFFNDINNFFKEFTSIDLACLINDINTLSNSEILKITPYDKETKQYDLQPLNHKEIYKILNNLSFEKYRSDFIICKKLVNFYNAPKFEKFKNDILVRLDLFEEIDNLLKEICDGKNLKEYYTIRVTNCKNKSDLINFYIENILNI